MEAVRCLVCMGLCFVMHGCGSGKIALDGVLGLGPEYRVSLATCPPSFSMPRVRACALENTAKRMHVGALGLGIASLHIWLHVDVTAC
jgi:hypothetical protein